MRSYRMDSPAADHFCSLIKSGLASAAEFEQALDGYFRARFKEVGAVGMTVEFGVGYPSDITGSPFLVLCAHLVEQLAAKHEFKPFKVRLLSATPDEPLLALGYVNGLVVEYMGCSIWVSTRLSSTVVTVSYSWPESFVKETDGVYVGGSHCSREYIFELQHPQSVEQIAEKFMCLCEIMPSQKGPPLLV